jgi:hypothetical protein
MIPGEPQKYLACTVCKDLIEAADLSRLQGRADLRVVTATDVSAADIRQIHSQVGPALRQLVLRFGEPVRLEAS